MTQGFRCSGRFREPVVPGANGNQQFWVTGNPESRVRPRVPGDSRNPEFRLPVVPADSGNPVLRVTTGTRNSVNSGSLEIP